MKTPLLLDVLLKLPLFDDNDESGENGGLEEIARDMHIDNFKPEIEQEDLAGLIYNRIVKACNSHEDLLEACKEALIDLDKVNEQAFGYLAMPTITMQHLQQAISKAEGRE